MGKKRVILIFLSIIFIFSSCSETKNTGNAETKINNVRYDTLLFSTNKYEMDFNTNKVNDNGFIFHTKTEGKAFWIDSIYYFKKYKSNFVMVISSPDQFNYSLLSYYGDSICCEIISKNEPDIRTFQLHKSELVVLEDSIYNSGTLSKNILFLEIDSVVVIIDKLNFQPSMKIGGLGYNFKIKTQVSRDTVLVLKNDSIIKKYY